MEFISKVLINKIIVFVSSSYLSSDKGLLEDFIFVSKCLEIDMNEPNNKLIKSMDFFDKKS